MKRTFLHTAALLLLASSTFATTTTLKWTAGWDSFGAPLNYKKSKVTYSVNDTTKEWTVTYTLVNAAPNSLYQTSVNFFCNTFPANFGQFAIDGGGGACQSITRQGVTQSIAEIEVGVITTDENGDGTFKVIIGPIVAGTYSVEFFVRNGAGCNLIGGAGNQSSDCNVDFQSPGPTFGDGTTITIP